MECKFKFNNVYVIFIYSYRSITAGVILGAADFTGQALERSGKDSGEDVGVDLARVARFAFFGFILQVSFINAFYE